MDKQALKTRMLTLEQAELDHAREKYAAFLADARLDPTEPHETDEISRAEFAGEMAEAFDQPVHDHAEKLAYLKALDFAPSRAVGEGAVVRIGQRWFVIAVSTARFDFDGDTLMGISTGAPIYAEIEGLARGDSFTFNGRQMSVEELY
jgi:hypothetical protein